MASQPCSDIQHNSTGDTLFTFGNTTVSERLET